MQKEDQIILVDKHDNPVGCMGKTEVHQKGLLHRAFSVFIFNSKKEMLLHQRAKAKYHSGGLWTNACCSHPRPGEPVATAANRRLKEEMGLECPLEEAFTFTYKATLDNGLIEHELDHVFIGFTDQKPRINKEEVAAYKYLSFDAVKKELDNNSVQFTEWFKICVEKVGGCL